VGGANDQDSVAGVGEGGTINEALVKVMKVVKVADLMVMAAALAASVIMTAGCGEAFSGKRCGDHDSVL
jgi:hypothetical protein